MFTARSFTDWPVSHKSPLRHIVVDETPSCVSSRALALHIANRVVVHIIVGERRCQLWEGSYQMLSPHFRDGSHVVFGRLTILENTLRYYLRISILVHHLCGTRKPVGIISQSQQISILCRFSMNDYEKLLGVLANSHPES